MITAMASLWGRRTAYEKLRAAIDAGISLEDYVEIRQQDYAVDRYLKFMESGTSSEVAVQLARDIAGLEPEELDENGRERVDLQRFRAVVDSGIDLDEQVAALGALMQEANTSKLRRLTITGLPGAVRHGQGKHQDNRRERIHDTGRSSERDRSDIRTQHEREAVLWQIINKSWSAASNPYNAGLSAQVRAAPGHGGDEHGMGLTLPGIEEDDEDEEDNMTDYR
jgi:primosomal protein N'